MPSINLKQMKIDEPTRNFDSSVDANTNIPGENDQGLFGGFKFFAGIKAFFKGISALGTLASGSRLPVTDSNGNVTYTTMNDINNYVVNNALTKQKTQTITYNGASFKFSQYTDKITVSCENNFSSSSTASDWVEIGTLTDFNIDTSHFATLFTISGTMIRVMIQKSGKIYIYSNSTMSGYVQDEDVFYIK